MAATVEMQHGRCRQVVTGLIVFDPTSTVRAHIRRDCSKSAVIPLWAQLTSRYEVACAQARSPSVLRDTLRSSGRFSAVCAPLSDLCPSRLTKRAKGNRVSLAICSWQIRGGPGGARCRSGRSELHPVTCR